MRNEVVAFSLVIEADTNAASGITVSMDSLAGPGGSIDHDPTRVGAQLFDWTTTDVELFYVRYLEIEGISMFHYGDILVNEQAAPAQMLSAGGTNLWADRPGANKRFPDIAVPLVCADGNCADAGGAFDISAGESQQIWVGIWIPRGLSPGVYTGNIRIDEPGQAQIAIPVSVTVDDLTMPDTPGPVPAFAYIQDSYVSWKHRGKARFFADDATTDAIVNKYFQLGHRHRIDLIGADSSGAPRSMRTGQRDRLDGDLFSAAQGYEGPGLNLGVHTHAIGPQGGGQWTGLWCAVAGNCGAGDAGVTSKAVNAYANAWVTAAAGWDADVFLYLIDEPATGNLGTYAQWGTWMVSGGSGLPTFVTKGAQYYSSMPDITLQASPIMYTQAAGWGDFDDNMTTILTPADRGYGYNGQRPLVGSHAVEDDGTALRSTMWAAYKLDLAKYWIWAVNYWQDPQTFGDYKDTSKRGDAQSEGVRDPFENPWTIGPRILDVCRGACSVSGASCSVDMQCPSRQTCDTAGVDGNVCTFQAEPLVNGVCSNGYCQSPNWGLKGGTSSNGDGVLMYPGRDFDRDFPASNNYELDGGFASLRLKHWRRGVQDLQYVAMAAAVDQAATDVIVETAVPSVWWERNNLGGYGNQAQSWSSNPDTWAGYLDSLRTIIASGGAGGTGDPGGTGGTGGGE